jgi:7-cyano-7-deazaguanine synthase in queuosine biosynthesis
MTTQQRPIGTFRFDYRHDEKTSERPGRALLTHASINEGQEMIHRLGGECPRPPLWVNDLFHIARAVYCADKLAGRHEARDRWTRRIDLSIQLLQPELWQAQLPTLTRLVTTLTGDEWSLDIVGGGGWREQTRIDLEQRRYGEVALFSGGLDSASYAATAGRRDDGELLLVSHFHNEKRFQDNVWQLLSRNPALRLHRIAFRQLPHFDNSFRPRHGLRREMTSRSRGLLLLAAGVYAAAAHQLPRLAVPENGQLALNPPLTPNRVGACSTRTVHPLTLHLMNTLIRGVGGDVEIYNPYRRLTKAQVCQRMLDAGCQPELLGATMSCSKAQATQRREYQKHCGCCWACLIRRVALSTVLPGGDPTVYRGRPWQSHDSADDHDLNDQDLKAVLYWLDKPFTIRDLATDLPLPPGTDAAELVDVTQRGRADLRAMLQHLLPRDSAYYQRLVAATIPPLEGPPPALSA